VGWKGEGRASASATDGDGNQEIPLDTSAFIRHYNEFL